jgi:hypothetical protein
MPLLASLEGSQDDAWPPSPPLPSLNVQPAGSASPSVLLVGLAGSSYWSMSVEADQQRAVLRFDVACRAREQPSWMGSRYRTMTCARLVPDSTSDVCRERNQPSREKETDPSVEPSADAAFLEIAGLGCRIETVPIGGLRAIIQVKDGVLSVQSPRTHDPPPQTWRWKYELRMLDAESSSASCVPRFGSA